MGGGLGGKAAIVTGGANGIGREIAPQLAAAGAAVLVADRDGAGAEAVAGEIAAIGGRAVGREVDVRDPADCEALAAVAHEAFGRLDVLVTSAGIAHSRRLRRLQGRSHRADARDGSRTGALQHHRQRDRAGAGRDAHGRRASHRR
jgi:NAD(P)-dependent dehydrogenase (short-subunit alcohol dehydrogenase family)